MNSLHFCILIQVLPFKPLIAYIIECDLSFLTFLPSYCLLVCLVILTILRSGREYVVNPLQMLKYSVCYECTQWRKKNEVAYGKLEVHLSSSELSLISSVM